MSFISRISNTAALLLRAAQTTDDVEEADAPTLPPRLSASHDPLALSTVFRGVQIIETAVSKLPLIQYAPDGSRMRPSTLITRPDLNRSRRDLFGDLVSALALNGNAFLLKVEAGGVLVGVRSLPPQLVTVTDLNMDPANPRLRYSYRGVDYGADRIVHLKLLNVAGRLRGMGPISAAREEIEGAQDTRAYASNWLDNTARPAGILKSDQILSDQDARTASERWAKGGAGGVRVLGKGLDYTPLALSPEDLQFIESQQFNTTQIARLLGIPASLMLAKVEGTSLTYSNIEQEWLTFAEYTLSAYADEICEALTSLLPEGQWCAPDWDSLHRSDTNTRYSAYQTAISAGFMTVDEARAREGWAPINQTTPQEVTL